MRSFNILYTRNFNNIPFFFQQIIMVDDKSSDLTIEVVRQYMNTNKGLNLSLLKLFSNRGKGGAIKAGVEFCRGKYILMVTLAVIKNIIYINFFCI